ncbi:hypothetical protein [Nitrospina watsonii]|uniref:Uncharacterized protein n=1 Tax=Nitrospina watsonii TaxID=1323948 RepID=A0ABM9HH90_9BACT|nr:hypothetical protein [Nitrospina watsonii]CAI2719367.1 protein of unknown function [Nitrospina watsonii]
MPKKKRYPIDGGFVALPHNLVDSKAFQALTNNAKITYAYFKRDLKNGHQTTVTLTFEQARNYGICKSPSTFGKAKKELVAHGFLDPFIPGGLNEPSVFSLSERWRKWGTPDFEEKAYQPGIGSKYFTAAWKNPERAQKLLQARHKKKPNTESI